MFETHESSGSRASRAGPWQRPAVIILGLLILSFLLNGYYLTGGFHADDLLLLNMLRQDPLPVSRWRGLWSTFDIPAFTTIWWMATDMAGTFWRPVTSLVIEGSIRLFGEAAFPLHLLSIVLHGLVAGGLYLFVRRLTGREVLGLLCGLIFLCFEDHSMTVGWITTLADLLCAFFVVLALNVYLVWLHCRRTLALLASLAALAVALGCKESAVVAPIILVLTALFFPQGSDEILPGPGISALRARAVSLARDTRAWAPAIALLVTFLVLYKGLSLGGMNNLAYVDPFSQPLAFLVHLIFHLPVMWLATLTPVFPSLTMFLPETVTSLALFGLIAFVVWLALLWPLRRRALVGWAMAFYLLGLLPQMGADASERLLYFPAIGAAVLLGCMVEQIGFIARRSVSLLPTPGRLAMIGGWIALVGVVLPSAALSAYYPYIMLPSLEVPERHALTALPHIREHQPDQVVVLNTSGMFLGLYLSGVVEHHEGEYVDIRLLSSCSGVVSVERLEGDSFALRTDRAGWLSNMFARIFRTGPLTEGEVYEKDLFTATLLELTPDGEDVLAVRFDVKRPLDDPALLFLYWDGSGFRPLDLAALPPGTVMKLADTSDVWGGMM